MLNPQVPSLLQKQILYLQLAKFAVVITDVVWFFQVSVRITTEELRKKVRKFPHQDPIFKHSSARQGLSTSGCNL